MRFLTFFALLLLFSPVTFSQVQILKDISPGNTSSLVNVDNAVARVGNFVFFAATHPDSGAELWKTDGTEEGTQLVKDINPGTSGSSLNNFYALHDSLLLFVADDGQSGLELWRSDGSEVGTFLVRDIEIGSGSGLSNFINNPQYYIVYENRLYFPGKTGAAGVELWASDGTEAGTSLVKNIATGGLGSDPSNFEIHNNTLFFSARTTNEGMELWKTNGTGAGTVLVKDIQSGSFGSNPSSLRSLNNTLIFIADDGPHDAELWKSDGTAAGTVLVKDIRTTSAGTFSTSSFATQPNSFENRFARLDTIAFFSAADDTHGIELWKTDGTEAGTVLVKDASPATISNGAYPPQNFARLGNAIFYKYDNDTTGIELWKSDGTEAGTHIVRDISAGSFGSFFLPTYTYTHRGHLYFGADRGYLNGFTGSELWQSDGTETGTILFADINAGNGDAYPNRFISLGKRLIFWATSTGIGAEPRVYTEPISISAATTSTMCFGDSLGTASLQVSTNGTAPFTAEWEPSWVSGISPANLPAGSYSVTVTDAEGGTGTASFTITEPTSLNVVAATEPEEGTAANGTASATTTGGTPPYSYVWNTNPLQTTAQATNLVAGSYTCIVTDAHGCTQSVTATVGQAVATSENAQPASLLKVYPNPANDLIRWTLENEQGISGNILREDGVLLAMLKATELSAAQANVSRFPAGIYFLTVHLKSGRTVQARFAVSR